MPLVTKAEFAETLGISRPRVSQFLKMGLPVRPDGLINLTAGFHWVVRNVEPDANCRGASVIASELLSERNSKPARSQSRQSAPSWRKGAPPIPPGFGVLEKISNPGDSMMVTGLLMMLRRVGSLASIAAHGAGAERKIAERTGEVFTALFAQAVTDILVECEVEPIASDPDAMVFPHPRNFDEVNWEALGPPGEFARDVNKSAKEVQK